MKHGFKLILALAFSALSFAANAQDTLQAADHKAVDNFIKTLPASKNGKILTTRYSKEITEYLKGLGLPSNISKTVKKDENNVFVVFQWKKTTVPNNIYAIFHNGTAMGVVYDGKVALKADYDNINVSAYNAKLPQAQ
jgi:hypothetical protein